MEIAGWLQRLLPKVEPLGRGADCWVAHVKMRTPAHHPPLYWLGRALDSVEELGALDLIRARLLATHGPETCAGSSEQDQRAQDVLTEACALAWAAEQLGPPRLEEVAGGERFVVHVPSLDAYLAPRRLRQARSPEALLRDLTAHASGAASELPAARGAHLLRRSQPQHGPLRRRRWLPRRADGAGARGAEAPGR